MQGNLLRGIENCLGALDLWYKVQTKDNTLPISDFKNVQYKNFVDYEIINKLFY